MSQKYAKIGGHGGARSGAGRKAAGDRIAENYRARFQILPLDRLLSIVNGLDPATGQRPSAERMDAAARAAAPFVHQRRAPLEIAPPKERSSLDLTKLSDDELRQLERIIAKSSYPPPAGGSGETS